MALSERLARAPPRFARCSAGRTLVAPPVASFSARHAPRAEVLAQAVANAVVLEQRAHCSVHVPEGRNSIVPAPAPGIAKRVDEVQDAAPTVPLFVSLCDEVCAACYRQPEAVRAGLKALQHLGVWGVVVNVWWGQVEPAPRQYDWEQYRAVFQVAKEIGLRVKVAFCFHGDEKHALPSWVLEAGQACPDIFPTDRSGSRNTECLSVGVDHVPVLGGRTPLQAYTQLLGSFRDAFAPLLGSLVSDAEVGLGPGGNLCYPSTPRDARWNFPGIGEFQCYDRFMVASLSAAAQQVGQPHWGNSGPHDAGSYCQWPHQTGFFHHQGSWDSEYGRFFLQWYASLLGAHADALLGAARRTLGGAGVRLHARLPTIHWWYNTAAHAAELTAGLYNTGCRNGYLALCQLLARHRVGLVLAGGEMADAEQPSYALASPQALLLQLRASAASQGVPVTLCNLSQRFDAPGLAQLEAAAFEDAAYRGIDVGHADALQFGAMGDAMFEPAAWAAFKDWAGRVREHNAALSAERAPRGSRRSGRSSGTGSKALPEEAPALAAAEQQQQEQLSSPERESALV